MLDSNKVRQFFSHYKRGTILWGGVWKVKDLKSRQFLKKWKTDTGIKPGRVTVINLVCIFR